MISRFVLHSLGSYSGCGNVWTVTENRRIDLDPAVTDIYRPWSVRNRPTMTWSANQSELYTLIVFDTGYLINHGIFLNIPGNNISQSEVSLCLFVVVVFWGFFFGFSFSFFFYIKSDFEVF